METLNIGNLKYPFKMNIETDIPPTKNQEDDYGLEITWLSIQIGQKVEKEG